MLRLMDARRIQEYDLRIRLCQDAQDAVARGLRLIAHDGNLLPDQRIDQGRLAHVRAANNGNKAGFMFLLLFH